MQAGEPQVYTALATLRNGYMQSQWGRVQMFLIFNTISLPIGFSLDGRITLSSMQHCVLGVIAIIFHVVMLNGTDRANRWIKFFDSRMADLECLDGEGDRATRVRVASHHDFQKIRNKRLASRKTFAFLCSMIVLLWILDLVYYIHMRP